MPKKNPPQCIYLSAEMHSRIDELLNKFPRKVMASKSELLREMIQFAYSHFTALAEESQTR